MVKALTFKGDKKIKKRKRVDASDKFGGNEAAEADLQAEKVADIDDDSWVTADAVQDLVGPIILILPSDTPSCLACDTSGKVFANALENVIDGDPSTAEPHDVRQVWIVSRIVGTNDFTFKGHHGRSVIHSIHSHNV